MKILIFCTIVCLILISVDAMQKAEPEKVWKVELQQIIGAPREAEIARACINLEISEKDIGYLKITDFRRYWDIRVAFFKNDTAPLRREEYSFSIPFASCFALGVLMYCYNQYEKSRSKNAAILGQHRDIYELLVEPPNRRIEIILQDLSIRLRGPKLSFFPEDQSWGRCVLF